MNKTKVEIERENNELRARVSALENRPAVSISDTNIDLGSAKDRSDEFLITLAQAALENAKALQLISEKAQGMKIIALNVDFKNDE